MASSTRQPNSPYGLTANAQKFGNGCVHYEEAQILHFLSVCGTFLRGRGYADIAGLIEDACEPLAGIVNDKIATATSAEGLAQHCPLPKWLKAMGDLLGCYEYEFTLQQMPVLAHMSLAMGCVLAHFQLQAHGAPLPADNAPSQPRKPSIAVSRRPSARAVPKKSFQEI